MSPRREELLPRHCVVIMWISVLALILPLLLLGKSLSTGVGVEPLPSVTNRCSDSEFAKKKFNRDCGAPLSSPCFDPSRCSRLSSYQDAPSTASTPSSSNSSFGGVGDGSDGSGGVSGGKIYVFDIDCSLSDSDSISSEAPGEDPSVARYTHPLSWVFRNAVQEAGVLVPTYESPCLFLHVHWGESEPCPVNTPLWNNGANHVMINFGDGGREATTQKLATSFAIDAASNMHSCLYRSGYDISIPLFPKTQFHYLADISPSDRRFFLTIKGTVYPGRHGSEERQSIVPLHNESSQVIVSMHCFEAHGEHLLPEFLTYCQQLKDKYGDYDYESLMNTTFALVPAGRSPASYRRGEVMGAGAIPVFVTRDYVLPFREQIDWASFSFSFPPDRVELDMMRTLKAVAPWQLDEMQRKSLEACSKMFRTDDDIDTLVGPPAFAPSAELLIEILLRRMGYRGGR